MDVSCVLSQATLVLFDASPRTAANNFRVNCGIFTWITRTNALLFVILREALVTSGTF